MTSVPLPIKSFPPKIEILIVPGVGVLNDKVRPPPFEVPTGPNVTPLKLITPALYVTVNDTLLAPVPARSAVFTGTVTGTFVSVVTAGMDAVTQIGVAVAMGVAVLVGEKAGVLVAVPVGVCVGVAEGVFVTVGVEVAVFVAVFVGVEPVTVILPFVTTDAGVPSLKRNPA